MDALEKLRFFSQDKNLIDIFKKEKYFLKLVHFLNKINLIDSDKKDCLYEEFKEKQEREEEENLNKLINNVIEYFKKVEFSLALEMMENLNDPISKRIIKDIKNEKKAWKKLISSLQEKKVKEYSKLPSFHLGNSKLIDIDSLITSTIIDKNNGDERVSFVKYHTFFKSILEEENEIIIYGQPGIGKSTLCKYLLYKWGMKIWCKDILLLFLRITIDNKKNTFYDEIINQNFNDISYITTDIIKSFFEEKLPNLILIIDLDDKIRLKEISMLNPIYKFNGNIKIIFVTRNKLAIPFKNVSKTIYEIKGFNNEQIEIFYENCFDGDRLSHYLNKFMEKLKDHKNNLIDLCKIPCLAMILYELGLLNKKNILNDNKYIIYENITDLIRNKLQLKINKKIEYEFLELCFKSVIGHLIMNIHELSDIINYQEYFNGIIYFNEENNVKFYHESFKYFFAAKYLFIQFQDIQEINTKFSKNHWDLIDQIVDSKNIRIYKMLTFLRHDSFLLNILSSSSMEFKEKFLISDKIHYLLEMDEIYNINFEFLNENISNILLKNIVNKLRQNIQIISFEKCNLDVKYLFKILSKTALNIQKLIIRTEDGQLHLKYEEFLGGIANLIRNTNFKELTIENINFNVIVCGNFEGLWDIYSFQQLLILSNGRKLGCQYSLEYNEENLLENIYHSSLYYSDYVTEGFLLLIENLKYLKNVIISNRVFNDFTSKKLFEILSKRKERKKPLYFIIKNCQFIEINKEFFINLSKYVKNNHDNKLNTISITQKTDKDELLFIINSDINKYTNTAIYNLNECKKEEILQQLNIINWAVGNNLIKIQSFPWFNLDFEDENINIVKDFNTNSKNLYFNGCNNENLENLLSFTIQNDVISCIVINNCKIDFKNLEILFNKNSETLIEFEIGNLCLTENNGQELGNCLINCKVLQSFMMNDILIEGKGIRRCLMSLKNSRDTIKTFIIQNCYLSKQDINILEKIITTFKVLENISIFHNKFLINNQFFNGFKINLNHNRNLKTIKISNLNWIYSTTNSMKTFKNLLKLNLSNNIFNNRTFEKVCQNLKFSFKSLQILNFSHCKLNYKKIEKLTELLNVCKYVRELDLSKNLISEKSLQTLSTANLERIINLNLSDCNLNIYEESYALINLLKKCIFIEKFNISHNSELGKYFSEIFSSLQNAASNLRELNFSDCNIQENCCENLQDLLLDTQNLEYLNLSKNPFIGYFNNFFSVLIKFNKTFLTHLDLSMCNFKNQDNDFQKFLVFCTSLKYFDFSFNNLDINCIIRGLSSSAINLNYLILQSCNLKSLNEDCLKTFLKSCSQLLCLDLSFNDLENASHIIDSLEHCPSTLNSLKLNSCNICFGDGKNVGNLIKKFNKLKELDLGSNFKIGGNFQYIFKGLLSSSKILEYLNFSKCLLSLNNENYLYNLLENCCNLKTLKLCFSNEGTVENLLKILENLTGLTLRNLELCGFPIKSEQIEDLVNILIKYKYLEIFNIYLNKNLETKIQNELIKIVENSNNISHYLEMYPWIKNAKITYFSTNSTNIPCNLKSILQSSNDEIKTTYNFDPLPWSDFVEHVRNYHKKELFKINFLSDIPFALKGNYSSFESFYMPLNITEIRNGSHSNEYLSDTYFLENLSNSTENICIVGQSQIGKTTHIKRLFYSWSVTGTLNQDYLFLQLPSTLINYEKSLVENLYDLNIHKENDENLQKSLDYYLKDETKKILILIDDGEDYIENPDSKFYKLFLQYPSNFVKIIWIRHLIKSFVKFNHIYQINGITPEANLRFLINYLSPYYSIDHIEFCECEFLSSIKSDKNLYEFCTNPIGIILIFVNLQKQINEGYLKKDDVIKMYLELLRKNRKIIKTGKNNENDVFLNYMSSISGLDANWLLSMGLIQFSLDDYWRTFNFKNEKCCYSIIEEYFVKEFIFQSEKGCFNDKLFNVIINNHKNSNEKIILTDLDLKFDIYILLYIFEKKLLNLNNLNIQINNLNTISITLIEKYISIKFHFKSLRNNISLLESNFFKFIQIILEKNEFLSKIKFSINFESCKFYNEDDFENIIKNLENCYLICENLSINDNNLCENELYCLSNYLFTQFNLTVIDLSFNSIGNIIFKDIMDNLGNSLSSLRSLQIRRIGIDSKIDYHLSIFISKLLNLKYLNISENLIGNDLCKNILNTLNNNSIKLSNFELSSIDINYTIGKTLLKFIKNQTYLVKINLMGNKIGNSVIGEFFVSVLKECKSLKSINLNSVGIDENTKILYEKYLLLSESKVDVTINFK